MEKKFLRTGILFLLLGVVIGAYGVHALKSILSAEQQASFETGVRYQIYHGLAFLVLPLLKGYFLKEEFYKRSFYVLLIGVVLFSGSIYALNLKDVMGAPELNKFIWPLTPVGGLMLITGWTYLFVSTFRFSVTRN